jgi:hypothetical protein
MQASGKLHAEGDSLPLPIDKGGWVCPRDSINMAATLKSCPPDGIQTQTFQFLASIITENN